MKRPLVLILVIVLVGLALGALVTFGPRLGGERERGMPAPVPGPPPPAGR